MSTYIAIWNEGSGGGEYILYNAIVGGQFLRYEKWSPINTDRIKSLDIYGTYKVMGRVPLNKLAYLTKII